MARAGPPRTTHHVDQENPMNRPGMVAFLLVLAPMRAAAQIPLLDGIFKSVQDANTSSGPSRLTGSSSLSHHGLTSVAFEVTLLVGSFGCKNSAPEDSGLRDAGGK